MKVLLVEDSRTVRAFVEAVLRGAPDLTLLPSAVDGAVVLERVLRERPDVVLLDLDLPQLSGLEVLQQVMAQAPVPVVVLSAHVEGPSEQAFASLAAGAVEVLAKPEGLGGGQAEAFAQRLLRTVRLMARARVVRRRTRAASVPCSPSSLPTRARFGCVLIGASTGGPSLLHELLLQLPRPYPLPIVIAQHLLPGFDRRFAEWLASSGHRALLAEAGGRPEPGCVYVAPSDASLALHASGFERVCEPESGRALPCVDVLFESAASTLGASSLALLLTGMGSDGARGLWALRQAGALTVAQDAPSCTVSSMPEAARRLDAVEHTLTPLGMTELLTRAAGVGGRSAGEKT